MFTQRKIPRFLFCILVFFFLFLKILFPYFFARLFFANVVERRKGQSYTANGRSKKERRSKAVAKSLVELVNMQVWYLVDNMLTRFAFLGVLHSRKHNWTRIIQSLASIFLLLLFLRTSIRYVYRKTKNSEKIGLLFCRSLLWLLSKRWCRLKTTHGSNHPETCQDKDQCNFEHLRIE